MLNLYFQIWIAIDCLVKQNLFISNFRNTFHKMWYFLHEKICKRLLLKILYTCLTIYRKPQMIKSVMV